MDSTFTCISSEELLVVEGGKIKTEDVCYWVGAGVGFGYSCLKLLLGYKKSTFFNKVVQAKLKEKVQYNYI